MKKSNSYLYMSIFLFAVFAVFTFLVMKVDVAPIGPNGTMVGFSGINGKFFEIFGTNKFWYSFSEKLGLTALLVCGAFALLGAYQLLKGKSIKAVDPKIILLGVFYVVVMIVYVFFNKVAVNYRPVFEADGSLESSYPSSHTMLALCVYMTMFMQSIFNSKGTTSEKAENVIATTILSGLMIFSRLFSGVHWFTDIVGGVIISFALVYLYKFAVAKVEGE